MAFSSDICGLQIQKKDTKFKEKKGVEINGQISRWISNDTLEIKRFKNNADLQLPKDTISTVVYEKAYGLTLKIINYDRTTGGFLNEYEFEEIEILKDKIKFKEITRILGPIIESPIEFSLGNIKIESGQDTISKIIVETIQTGMNGQYRNSDNSITENLPQIMYKTIYFYPTKKLRYSDLENKNGIFYKLN